MVVAAASEAESHAVVIGASVAGLLAATALSEAFPRVTVYDRDALPDGPQARRGVPQGRQAHGLHARGVAALEELLPGFRTEMLAAGGVEGDAQADVHWYLDGRRLAPGTAGLDGIGMTRRSLEWLIRRRVEKLPNVSVIGACAVDGLVTDGSRVTGVRLSPSLAGDYGPGAPEGYPRASGQVAAALVVDAAGRGSRTPAWLAELGYPQPVESRLRADIVYVTRYYQHRPGQLGGIIGAAAIPYPGHPRGGALIWQEGGQWALTLVGMLGTEPPADDEGMLAYADTLAAPELAAVMRASPPLGRPVKMRFPGSVRRRYGRTGRLPGGLVVLGDALCSFNPVYAQGMTIAALEALALRRELRRDPRSVPARRRPQQVAARFSRAADKLVTAAWATSAGGDLRFPEVRGRRGPASRLAGAYLTRLYAAACADPAVGKAFLRVANMIDPPARLLAPRTAARVWRVGRDRADRGSGRFA
jgi:2-polyprenyl-6-methoxyphenol hydroxylase-like FAD-dependent oxidoreductase